MCLKSPDSICSRLFYSCHKAAKAHIDFMFCCDSLKKHRAFFLPKITGILIQRQATSKPLIYSIFPVNLQVSFNGS
jgi:hypothetical protein